MTLLRAMDPQYSSTAAMIREFYRGRSRDNQVLNAKDARARLVGDAETAIQPMMAVDDVIDPETGEVYLDSRQAVLGRRVRPRDPVAGEGSDRHPDAQGP